MNKLPDELILLILDHLNLINKVKLRCLSKKIKFLIDNYSKIENLFIAKRYSGYYYSKKWFHNHEYLDVNNLILNYNLIDKFFDYSNLILQKKVNQLVIYCINTSYTDKLLKTFNLIEKLSINCLNYDEFKGKFLIKLNNLKILELNKCMRREIDFKLPQLKKLSIEFDFYHNGLDYKFEYPESVEFIKFDTYNKLCKKFKNLKILMCFNFENDFDNNRIESNFLTNFNQLKELHLNEQTIYDEMKKQKQKFNLKLLEIYLFGLKLSDLKDCNGCTDDLDNKKLEFYIHNLSKLNYCIPFNSFIDDYDQFKNYSNRLSVELFKKFYRFDSISVSKPIDDYDTFINFIAKAGRIQIFRFNYLCFSIELFNKLSNVTPYIEYLQISNNNNNLSENDLRILFKFTRLGLLRLDDQLISLELCKEFFKNLKYLTKLNFYYQNINLCLSKTNTNCYEIFNASTYSKHLFNDINLIEFK